MAPTKSTPTTGLMNVVSKNVHPLTDEGWRATRFFVCDPEGNVTNITAYRE